MIKKTINFGEGISLSMESDGVVPDTTKDAGPDTIKLHEDAQKPENDPNAEYDAAQHVDVPEDVEKANESTFFGIILKHRSEEAFAKTKGSFPSAEAFFKSNECKQAIAVAKQWAEKHKLSSASVSEVPEGLKKLGCSTKTMAGLVLAYVVKNNKAYIDVLFKKDNGKVSSKKFAVIKVGEAKKEAGSESTPPASTTTAPAPTPKAVLSKENDPVDNAFSETTDPTPPPAPAAPAATTEPPATTETPPAEPPAEPSVEVAPEISGDEIEEEAQGTESFIGAISRVFKSREEADAAVSTIEDKEADEVVGDNAEEIEETTSAEPTEPTETTSDEEKSIEAFLAEFNESTGK